MRKRKKVQLCDTESNEVDMTPMLDIVFIMLIFFIVTTTFIKASGINIERPNKSLISTKTKIESITIKAESNELLKFNGRFISSDSVRAIIESAKSKNPKILVQVLVEQSLQTGVLVDIVDQVRLAGISQVTVAKLL